MTMRRAMVLEVLSNGSSATTKRSSNGRPMITARTAAPVTG